MSTEGELKRQGLARAYRYVAWRLRDNSPKITLLWVLAFLVGLYHLGRGLLVPDSESLLASLVLLGGSLGYAFLPLIWRGLRSLLEPARHRRSPAPPWERP